MKKFILLIFILGLPDLGQSVENEDPNSYFRDKDWKIEVNKKTSIHAHSKYNGEPIQKPSVLNAELECPSKKSVVVIKDLKFCGIDSIKMIGNKLEIHFADYNYKDPKGYCNKKRKVYIPIPQC